MNLRAKYVKEEGETVVSKSAVRRHNPYIISA